MTTPAITERHIESFAIDTRTRSYTRQFTVWHVYDKGAAESLAIANTPAIDAAGLIRRRVQAERMTFGHWEVSVEFGTGDPSDAVAGPIPEPPEVPEFGELPLGAETSFDMMGQTTHITQARNTVWRVSEEDGPGAKPPGSAPDENLAIGLTQDRVEGADIYTPALTFTRTVTVEEVTYGYIRALYRMVGTVNEQPFFQFQPGEVLYLGVSGAFNFKDRWRVSHKFAVSPNERDLKIGTLTVPTKEGWQYLWVYYRFEEVEFADGKLLMQVPRYAYVQDLYRKTDFEAIGIGGGPPPKVDAPKKKPKPIFVGVGPGAGIVIGPEGVHPFPGW